MPVMIRTTGVQQYLDESGGSYIKCLILGEPSAGKTRWSSFFPKPIFAATEDGLMSVADRGVPYALVKSTADMESLLLQVESDARQPLQERAFGTFVLDTADSMQRWMMDEILREQRHDAMELRDWGLLGQRFSTILRRVLRLPMNIVVTCHVKGAQDGDGPLVSGPGLQGAAKDQLAAEFDLVGHMATFWEAHNGERVLKRAIKWHPEPAFPILKDRSGQLPKYTPVTFSEDDFIDLRDLMFGGAYFEALPESEDVVEVPDAQPVGAQPEAPKAGGPVAVKAAPAKKTAAPPKEPAPTPQARRVPAAKKPAPEPTPVVEDPVPSQLRRQPGDAEDHAGPADPEPQPEASTEPEVSIEDATAAVVEHLGGTEVTPPPAAVASPQLAGITCGTPARGKEPTASGCGKDLANENMDGVNIAVMQFKAQLCQSCFTEARKAKRLAAAGA